MSRDGGRSAAALSTATLMEALTEVARLAGSTALQHFKRGLAVETKADGSPVTIADRASEAAAREWIERRFPDDGILGEEFGATRADASCRWLLDPIDGTKTFVRGVPLWGTLVAVTVGESVLAGAAHFPAVDERLVAAPGAGCWWNGARCRVSEVGALESATVLATDERFLERPDRGARWRALSARAAVARSWGDCYGYLLVATGRAEAMTDPVLSPWDSAALQPLVTEAGGVFTDWEGRATAFGGSAIATNAALAADIREALGCST
jgi:histidinol phosphatase-like enzyme (inositol monophosphatase family)